MFKLVLLCFFFCLKGSVVKQFQPRHFKKSIENESSLVLFYAPWCPHCQVMEPIYKSVGDELEQTGNICSVWTVNCDQESSTCQENSIKGYPTILFFKDGRKVVYNGGANKAELLDFIAKNA